MSHAGESHTRTHTALTHSRTHTALPHAHRIGLNGLHTHRTHRRMHRANMRLWLGLLRGVFFFDRNAYDGDVVFSAGLERQPDERRTRIIERMRLGYRLANHRI